MKKLCGHLRGVDEYEAMKRVRTIVIDGREKLRS